MAEILMVRHGQAAFGTDNYDRLTELGWEQSRILGEHFAATEQEFDAVYTGNLRRHRETLAGIQQALPALPSAAELPGLNEFDFHSLVTAYRSQHLASETEVTDAKTFYGCLRDALLAWNRNELDGLSEDWGGFETRVRGTLSDIAAERGRVLVVSSGGPISAVVREVLSLGVEQMVNLNLQAINTGITRYFANRKHWRLNMFNAVPHLEPAQHRHLITYT